MKRDTREWLLVAAAYAAGLLLVGALNASRGVPWPLLVSFTLTIVIFALFALGLNLEFGYTGLLNFGHVATMAIGAYTTVLLSRRFAASSPLLEGLQPAGLLAMMVLALAAALIATAGASVTVTRLPRRPHNGWLVPAGLGATIGLLALLALAAPTSTGAGLSPQGAAFALTLLCFLAATLVAALFGLLIGLPAVRLREDYLAIVTLGAAEILRSVLTNEESWTGGTLGIHLTPDQKPLATWARADPSLRAFRTSTNITPPEVAHLLLALAVLALAFALLNALVRSPWGRVLRAIREDETVAASLGKNVQWFKLQVLMIGSVLGAAAGLLLAWKLENVYPDDYVPIYTFYAFIILIVGGVGNLKGALAGSIILWTVLQVASGLTFLQRFGFGTVAGPPQGIAIGLLIILVMALRPHGLVGNKEELLYAR